MPAGPSRQRPDARESGPFALRIRGGELSAVVPRLMNAKRGPVAGVAIAAAFRLVKHEANTKAIDPAIIVDQGFAIA